LTFLNPLSPNNGPGISGGMSAGGSGVSSGGGDGSDSSCLMEDKII
jgi:hypothetical protein